MCCLYTGSCSINTGDPEEVHLTATPEAAATPGTPQLQPVTRVPAPDNIPRPPSCSETEADPGLQLSYLVQRGQTYYLCSAEPRAR